MSEQTELEPQALQRMPTSQPMVAGVNIEALLEKAVDAKSAVDVLERLAVMRREMKAEAAKEAFDSAMAQFQAECPVIKKTEGVRNSASKGGGIRYYYAPLDAIIAQTKELIQKHGFSYRVTAEVNGNSVKAICKIIHCLGHAEQSEFQVPIDTESYMNQPQRFASAMTFAKRYAFCNSLGILTGDGDDDARTVDPDRVASQNARPPAQTQPPIQHPRNQTPKPPPATAKCIPTVKTREWAIGKLVESPGHERILVEFLQKAGAMRPDETNLATEWPLQYVPAYETELEALRKAVVAFEAGDPNPKIPFYHAEAILGDAPAAPAKEKPKAKPVEVPRDADAGDQSESATAVDPNWEKVTGAIAHVSVRNGKSNRGPWTCFGVKIGDDWFNTFNKKLGALAQGAKGREVDLYYSANDKGKTAEHIEV